MVSGQTSRVCGKPLMQEGLDPASRNCCAECKLLRSSTCPKTRRVDRAHVGWRPWHGTGRPDSVSDSESECCDQEGLEPSFLLQHGMTSQRTCFFSPTPPCAMLNTLVSAGSSLAQGSAKSLLSCRDRRNLVSWIQWHGVGAPTMNEKDAILEAMQEQQDWEDAPLPRWPGDADFQLSPT